jgi:hypothetical protein
MCVFVSQGAIIAPADARAAAAAGVMDVACINYALNNSRGIN